MYYILFKISNSCVLHKLGLWAVTLDWTDTRIVYCNLKSNRSVLKYMYHLLIPHSSKILLCLTPRKSQSNPCHTRIVFSISSFLNNKNSVLVGKNVKVLILKRKLESFSCYCWKHFSLILLIFSDYTAGINNTEAYVRLDNSLFLKRISNIGNDAQD